MKWLAVLFVFSFLFTPNAVFGFTASEFATEYGDDLFHGEKIQVLVEVKGEPQSDDPIKRAKEIRYLQSAVLKFIHFAGATNVKSDTWNNEFTAIVTASLAEILEQRNDVISIEIIQVVEDLPPELQVLAEEPPSEFWESLAPMPTPRTEVVAIPVNEKIYIIGGFDNFGRGTDIVEVYDTVRNTWESVSPIPERLHHVGAAAYSEEIFVVGGYMDGWNPSNSLFIYDTLTDSWRSGPSMPTARGALTVQFLGDILYSVGGADGVTLSVNEAFDTKTSSWHRKAPMPTSREHLSSAVVGERMYVIGGRVMSMSANLGTNEVYHSLTDSWQTLEEMPTPRGGLTASPINGTIFVFGGESTFGTFDENEQYLPEIGWQTNMQMPTSRHGLGSATVGDRIYVIGGGVEPGLSVSGINESYYNPNYIPEFGSFSFLMFAFLLAIIFGIIWSRQNPTLQYLF